jgi:hypothetical protein
LLRYPPGCKLQLISHCVGEPKTHWRFHDPDPAWFYAAGDFHSGYIAAADIRAGAVLSVLPMESCDGGAPLPSKPEITAPIAKTIRGPIEIAAAAPNASEVGFAAYYEDQPGQVSSATWHQIGVDLNTADGVDANWDTRSVPGQSLRESARVTIAAIPCLGLDNAFSRDRRVIAGTRPYVVANRGGPAPAPAAPPRASMQEAGASACNNQGR